MKVEEPGSDTQVPPRPQVILEHRLLTSSSTEHSPHGFPTNNSPHTLAKALRSPPSSMETNARVMGGGCRTAPPTAPTFQRDTPKHGILLQPVCATGRATVSQPEPNPHTAKYMEKEEEEIT